MTSPKLDRALADLMIQSPAESASQQPADYPVSRFIQREEKVKTVLLQPVPEAARTRALRRRVRIQAAQASAQAPVLPPRGRFDSAWIKGNNRNFAGIRKKRRTEVVSKLGTSKRGVQQFVAMSKELNTAHYQRHMIHMMMRVLSLRTNASPFTLILDDLAQSAEPVLEELTRRAFSRNVPVIYLSFDRHQSSHPSVQHITLYAHLTGDRVLADLERAMVSSKENLVIIESLADLLNEKHIDMGELFNLISSKYCSTLVGVWHQDLLPAYHVADHYAPQQLDVVKFMATTIITCKSFAHALAAKAAKQRSLPEPTYGLLQGAEGIIQSLESNDARGVVLETEFRRMSGRPESATYFLRPASLGDYHVPIPGMDIGALRQEFVTLLELVPAYINFKVTEPVTTIAEELGATFNLSLTDRQRQARDDVVLPYYDAQNSMGEAGEGGRILYDMGAEDDFDEEEDEI